MDEPVSSSTRSRSRFRWSDRVYLVFLWVLATGYNLFKPYHIDDAAYVLIAKWISANPLHPMRGNLNWVGVDEPIYRVLHPHLYMYIMAGWGNLFGFAAPSLHIVQSLAALGCILLTYRLINKFAPDLALWATAILILGPGFIVEQNMMIDVPLLFLWLAFFNAIIVEIDSPSQNKRFVIASLACSAGLLTKYSSAVLIPILVFSLFWERRIKQAWTVAIPAATLVAWSAFNYWDVRRIHLLVRPAEGQHHSLSMFALTWLVTLGGLTPLGIVGAFRLAKREWIERAGYCTCFLGFIGILIVAARSMVAPALIDKFLALGFIANGLAMVISLAAAFLQGRISPGGSVTSATRAWASVYLMLWITLTTAFYIVFAPFIAARHVLLVLPAITLIAAIAWQGKLSATAKLGSLAFTFMISAGLCVSDFRFARFQKVEAAEVASHIPQNSTGWTNGHLGWMYYAQMRGVREYDPTKSVIKTGDTFAVSSAGLDDLPVELSANVRTTSSHVEDAPLLSLICSGRPARLYRSDLKHGAWSVSANCSSQVDVYEVIKPHQPESTATR